MGGRSSKAENSPSSSSKESDSRDIVGGATSGTFGVCVRDGPDGGGKIGGQVGFMNEKCVVVGGGMVSVVD